MSLVNKKINILNKSYKDCQKCPFLREVRTHVVFGNGSLSAQLMIIGEAPGHDEDILGVPFVGRSGKLLTTLLQEVGIAREDVYISNVVKCRPPHNRVPLIIERETCKEEILFKEIALIKPKIICTLGATAAKALLGSSILFSRVRGEFLDFMGASVLPTYHPAYILRKNSVKSIVLDDFRKIVLRLNVL
jgi:DNA polymerase